MENDNESNRKTNYSENDSRLTLADAGAIESRRHQYGANQEFYNSKKKMNIFEKITLILGVIGLVVGGFTLRAFYRQLGEMQAQTALIDRQVTQAAKDSIESAAKVERQLQISQQQAGSAKDSVAAIQKQTKIISDQVDSTKAEAIISRGYTEKQIRALEAQAQSSRESVTAIQEQMRLDERAWIGMLKIDDVSFNQKDGLHATIVFLNSGKTPASNVEYCNGYDLSEIPLHGPPPEYIKGLSGCVPAKAIGPQGTFKIGWGYGWSAEPETEAQRRGLSEFLAKYQAIKEKKSFPYIFGTIKYDDAFSNRRETDFCIFLADPDKPQIAICDTFNDIK